MSALPTCRHRGPTLPTGRRICHHPQLAVPEGVDQATCDECRATGLFCDQEPRDLTREILRNKRPHLLSRVWNLTRSLKAFVGDGLTTVDKAQYQRRLELCHACPERWNDDCKICGCRLSWKARGRAFGCPLGKWLAVVEPSGGEPRGPEPDDGQAIVEPSGGDREGPSDDQSTRA
ncbi:MAG: hypothetical protein JNJ59_25495 [Deltaproteobacteria bacterium]|nr:hypothetical protein [Deltaproteobacteria bacterium]